MSVWTTVPLAPTLLAKARARSPVPPAMSSTLSPGAGPPPPPCRPSRRGAGRATSGRSSGRTSAPPSRRRRARGCALRALVDGLKAEMGLAHRRCVRGRRRAASVVMAASRGRRSLGAAIGASRSAPAAARRFSYLRPQLVLLRAEEVEVVPREDAGVVAVAEGRLHRVVADRLERVRPTSRLPVCSTSCPGPCPCTSADGE